MRKPIRAVWEGVHPSALKAMQRFPASPRLARQLLAHEPLTRLDSQQKRLLLEVMRLELALLKESGRTERRTDVGASFQQASDFLSKQRKGERIEVLDIGTETSPHLERLKQRYPNIVTHGTTNWAGNVHADVQHFLLAEALPKNFLGRFKLITSDMTFYLTILPDLALRNTVNALAPKGKAILDIHLIGGGFGDLHVISSLDKEAGRLTEKIKTYYKSRKKSRLTHEEIDTLKACGRDISESSMCLHMMKKAFLLELGELQRTAANKMRLEFFDELGKAIPAPKNIFDLDNVFFLHITRLN
ncbi:MAG: hypothetical protein AABW72_01350 [archaeon]